MKQKINRYWLKFREFMPWIIAMATVFSANWASEMLYETFNERIKIKLGVHLTLIAHCVFFTIMVYLLYRQRNVFFRPRTRYLTNIEEPEPRKHLTLFLSNISKELEKSNGIPEEIRVLFSNDINKFISRIDTLKRTNPSFPRWSWEMTIRGIRCHIKDKTLKTVTLVCSRESVLQTRMFLNICKQFIQLKDIAFHILIQREGKIKLADFAPSTIAEESMGFNFESFDELSHAMLILLREFNRKTYLEHEIMIDFTGGQKVTSVVAVAMTFNRKIKAQYVQTNDPWKVLSYDVILASSDTERLGI